MPTYAYTCTACQHSMEVRQSFSDDALTRCPECDGRLRKRFDNVGVVFKGSGFYRNDSRAPEGGKTPKGQEKPSSGSGGGDASSSSGQGGGSSAPGSSTTSGGGSGSSGGGSTGSGGSTKSGSGSSGAGSKASTGS